MQDATNQRRQNTVSRAGFRARAVAAFYVNLKIGFYDLHKIEKKLTRPDQLTGRIERGNGCSWLSLNNVHAPKQKKRERRLRSRF